MSVENLKEYGRRARENDEVRAKAKELGMGNLEGQMEHARSLGLDFTQADLDALASEVGSSEDALSEEQLESVAGGLVSATAMGVAALAVAVVGAGAAVTSTTQAGGW